jgi:hypothetical protein
MGSKNKIVYVDLDNLIEKAKEIVIATNGGVNVNEIEYIGIEYQRDLKPGCKPRIKFLIPDTNEAGLCNELFEPTDVDGEGCGETGGACICGEEDGHEGDHVCRLCGESW